MEWKLNVNLILPSSSYYLDIYNEFYFIFLYLIQLLLLNNTLKFESNKTEKDKVHLDKFSPWPNLYPLRK